MIDASKISAGDWVETPDGWFRVVGYSKEAVQTIDSTPFVKGRFKEDITAHRPKSGPFKVGDKIKTRVVPVSEQTIKRIDGLRCFFDERAWLYEEEIDLVKPVEAIEAERVAVPRLSLESYLRDEIDSGVIDFSVRASIASGDRVTFYIHPLGKDGETADYEVAGNQLHHNRDITSVVPSNERSGT